MRSLTASGTPSRRHRLGRSLALLLLAGAAVGCPANEKREAAQAAQAAIVRLVDRAPIIQGVVITADGKRLRVARKGARMDLFVLATDPDGDRLQYTFVSEPDTTVASVTGSARARWTPTEGPDPARVRIRVADPRGRVVELVLSAESEPRLAFGGQVVDVTGRPIALVDVAVDGATTRTDAAGRFAITLPDRDQKKFVLNLAHPNYGPASHVLADPVRFGRWVLAVATVVPVDLRQPVSAQVSTGSCATIPSSTTNWTAFPRQHAGVTVSGYTAFTTTVPAELAAALQWAESQTTCPAGFSVRAGANAFVRTGGGAPAAAGQVTLAQLPGWGGASMPGDYTVRLANGQARAMRSFGAAAVRVTSNGESLQLAPGQRATLRWPVDPIYVQKGAKPIAEVPLLRYDEPVGEWKANGVARLDSSGTGWTAEVDHLSTFNLDLLKTDQSCVRIDATAMVHGPFLLEVIIPQGTGAAVKTVTLDNTTTFLHAIYNLPSNVMIAMRPFVDVSGTPEPRGTFVISTGDPQDPTDPNAPAYPYAACKGVATLVDYGGTTTITETDNDPLQSGMLVPVYVGLVDRPTDDLYPIGAGAGFPVVGIFDNGSTSVYVSGVAPNRFSGSTTSDAGLLGVTHGTDVEIRVSPMQSSATVAGAPMGGPLGGGALADASLPSVRIKVTTSSPRDLTLVGAPFAVKHLAWIDYTVGVPIAGSTSGELGAWSQFFALGETGFPVAQVTLPMTKFGTSSSAGSYSLDQRFLLTGVTFFHIKGMTERAVGHAVPGSTDKIWYDAGSTWTAISSATTSALGLTAADIIGPCYTSGSLYRVDRVEFVGTGGRYVVKDAMVCSADAAMAIVNGSPTQAMIGSNLFRREMLLVDGLNDAFGIRKP